MRKTLAIFFLFALSLPTLYKAGFFTFYQLNKDFIAENYCVNKERPITMCYGKCFLEKGLTFADQMPVSKNLSAQLKFESSEFEYSYQEFTFCLDLINQFSFSSTSPSLTKGITTSVFRPPLG